MGNGIIKEIEDIQEKQKALQCIMKHQTGKDFEFDEKAIQNVAIFKLDVFDFSCKKH